jgi:hypothetical protein
MRQKNIFTLMVTLFCLLSVNEIMSQSFVKNLDITPNEAKIQFEENPSMGYLIEIGGPGSYYWRTQVIDKNEIIFKNKRQDGGSFLDGNYTMQVTPMVLLTPEQREEMRSVSQNGTPEEIAALKEQLNIPSEVKFFNYNFHIVRGEFALPDLKEEKMKTPSSLSATEQKALENFGNYASLNQRWDYSSNFSGRAWDGTQFNMDDQVIVDDLIVQGSGCFGFDCSNGESFGFDTVRLKENNLRIKAQDTSNSASFPTNDWQITFNDSSNGGANKFSIDDIDGGRTPFTIEAGAPSHSLYADDGGRIGLGTSTPVVEIHSKDGDSPTLRLEQDGSSGFTPQIWDVAGNETNFFIRDASNGSTLPFRIRPSAPSNSIYIDTDGDVGLGTSSPDADLHVIAAGTGSAAFMVNDEDLGLDFDVFFGVGNTGNVVMGEYGSGTKTGTATKLLAVDATGNVIEENLSAGGASPWIESGANVYRSSGKVGIGTASPTSILEIKETTITPVISINSTSTGSYHGIEFLNKDNFDASLKHLPVSGTLELNSGRGPGWGAEITFVVDNVEQGRINTTGIGIGTTSPGYKLQVGESGDGTEARANAWNTFSDRRLKRDFQKIEDPLNRIANINGYYYYWTKDKKDQTRQVGVIAQEIEAVLPEIVSTDKEGIKSVNYSKLSALFIEAIKEQNQIINAQRVELDALKQEVSELAELKAQVNQLTQLVMKQNEPANTTEVGEE